MLTRAINNTITMRLGLPQWTVDNRESIEVERTRLACNLGEMMLINQIKLH